MPEGQGHLRRTEGSVHRSSSQAKGEEEFKASMGWFYQFQEIIRIHRAVLHGEAAPKKFSEAQKVVQEGVQRSQTQQKWRLVEENAQQDLHHQTGEDTSWTQTH